MLERAASLVIPALILLTAAVMIKKGKAGADAFINGARAGLNTTVGLIPSMVMLTVGLSMFCASGAVEVLARFLAPVTDFLGIPSEILPLIITRPVSGAASTATFAQLLEQYGPDSLPSLCASVMLGSSDTLIYVISVYFSGAPGVRKTGRAFPVATAVMVLCVLLSCFLCRTLL